MVIRLLETICVSAAREHTVKRSTLKTPDFSGISGILCRGLL